MGTASQSPARYFLQTANVWLQALAVLVHVPVPVTVLSVEVTLPLLVTIFPAATVRTAGLDITAAASIVIL